MSLLGELAGFVAETSFDDLPGHVVEASKMRIMDTIGGGIWGREEGDSDRLVRFADGMGGFPEATLWGGRRKVTAIWAAFINGFASFFVSDTDRFCGSHAGAVVVPAAMALGEKNDATGKEFITAVVLGYEVFSRVGSALFPQASKQGFHTTGLIGPLGSAAAVSKLFGFNKEQITHTLSIASLSGMGLGEAFKYLDTVSLNIGRVGQAGLVAAMLVESGFKGSETILEGGTFIKEGFLTALVGSYDANRITAGLGSDYRIVNSAPKIHGGCRHLAAPTDAVMTLAAAHGLKPEDIEEIRVDQYSEAFRLEHHEVKNRDDALWSCRFTIATALVTEEPVYPTKFTDEMLANETIRKLMAKVKVEANPELDKEFPTKWPVRVEIITTDGKTYSGGVDYPKGEPENPISGSEWRNKFKTLASKAIGLKNAEAFIDTIDVLEKNRVKDLAQAL
jgi:2-methylcitrate dehydratase PrpD